MKSQNLKNGGFPDLLHHLREIVDDARIIHLKITIMTLDKIRIAIGEYLWDFWQNNHNVDAIKRAEKTLRHEIEEGILRDHKYFAEYELLCMKLGIKCELNLK